MSRVRVNGVDLFYELAGAGEPLVLVHGSWTDHRGWRFVLPRLTRSFRVLVYDRRGHSLSERPPGQGTRAQDEADLAALVETLDLAPAHVVGNSFGGATALGLATRRPELLRTLAVHEPPLMDVVDGDPELRPLMRATRRDMDAVLEALRAGEEREGARLFVERVASGPGEWERMPERIREGFVANAPTFADEHGDPDWARLDLTRLAGHAGPVMLTSGGEGLPWFPVIIGKLAAVLGRARVETLEGAGHVPHLTHPDLYVDRLTAFIEASAAPPRP
ncbi:MULTISPECIES: alpha/beta fold hydrolase [unclassified Streptomyces]|uniref:alpha/beta fold hydrolase n=1 Tax=unclassified Streptomyces TaxID=2593676 RepID=UPI002257B2B2|nr:MULTISPECIES: alpha/beta hydrolase [unclassified Streptomyces]MCX4527794.1 alpha/beta hydrolase [Streptomyces sp. NBC_01551]MCX4541609.1 alpha/beta hydrolase [Streptomyces sp. NBC_01565]